jgi:hypothetical protein
MRSARTTKVALAVVLIQLRSPNGQPIEINPAEISSMRPPLNTSGRWAKDARCVLVMTNGRVNAVAEECAAIMRMLVER